MRHIKVFKKDMFDVKKGDECTITLEEHDIDIRKGDEIVAYQE